MARRVPHYWLTANFALLTLAGCVSTANKPTPSDLALLLGDNAASVDAAGSQGSSVSAESVKAHPSQAGESQVHLAAHQTVPHQATASDEAGHSIEEIRDHGPLQPFSIRGSRDTNWKSPEPWDMTIDEAIQLALANSTVMRSLGARIIQSPSITSTIYEPAISLTDPTAGVEAALSEYDARLKGDLFYEDNDRVLNNEFTGQGNNFFKQYLTRFESSLSKRTASGTTYTLRHNFDADNNNSDRNLIEGRAWAWNFEGEVRQALLQGRSVSFNRIAGPNATPGIYNGVVIAKVNADATVADLEIALRDFLSDVENAYWDLHFAYEDLNVKREARDRTLHTYQLLKARQGLPGAEEDKLAQALEQYYRFEEEVQNSLAGRLVIGTRSFNGSGGGTFQGTGGVYSCERRLRMVMGLSINDGRLIRTSSEPTLAPITYDWNNVASNAITRRTELKRQRLNVDRRRYELSASRNFLMPRLDAVGRYRYRALGDSWLDDEIVDSGSDVMTNTHEFLVGLSMNYPIGFRQASAGVRNAQLKLAREQSLLDELERQVIYGISSAIAESDRAYAVLRTAINRENAARKQYEILVSEAQAPVRQFNYNALLDSEQRFAEASSAANRARVQYVLATKNINFEMGALLEYYNIHLAGANHSAKTQPSRHRLRQLFGSVWDRTVESFPKRRSPAPSHASTLSGASIGASAVSDMATFEDQIDQIISQELQDESLGHSTDVELVPVEMVESVPSPSSAALDQTHDQDDQ